MHRVAGEAGQLALQITGRLDVRVVLVSSYTTRSVLPIGTIESLIGFQRRLIEIGKCQILGKVFVAWSKTDSLRPGFFGVVRGTIMVTAPTNLDGADFGTTCRIDDRRIGFITHPLAIAIP